MKHPDMNHRAPRDGAGDPSPLDPELALITRYLTMDLPPDEWDRVDTRLANDDDFHDKAWPLLKAFKAPQASWPSVIPGSAETGEPLPEVSDAEVRRLFEAFCAAIGRTPDLQPIVTDVVPGAEVTPPT